jgi:hypothetical protein
MNFEQFYQMILTNKGGSHNPTTGELNPITGYMVSLSEHEQVVDLDQFRAILLAAYTKEVADHLSPITFIGVWINGGKVYFDLSENIADKFTACYTGILRSQKAIWDCAKEENIYLPSPQRSGTSYQQQTYAKLKAREIATS